MSTKVIVSAKRSRVGRRSIAPTTPVGLFIQRYLDSMGMTRLELAKRLRVSPSTIGRLLNGDTQVVQRISAESICEALELQEMDRRTFLKLSSAVGASTFAFPTGAKVKKYRVDLDLAYDHADALSRLIDRGETGYVRESAQRWYGKLTEEQGNGKDESIARIQVRFGILLGASQEFTLPQPQRSQVAIQTYNHVEEHIILRFNLNTFQQDYANVLSHRAPLYRTIGDFEESLRQYEDAMYWVKRADDPRLRASLFRNRPYIWAIQGDKTRWRQGLEEARRDLQNLSVYHDESTGLIDYAEGEGYKQFAFDIRKDLSIQAKMRYARRALDCFERSRSQTQGQPMSHHLQVAVSEAQCLIWLDPTETLRRIELMWSQAEQFYPSLLEKMRRTVQYATQRLQARKYDSPLLLDLNARD